MWDVRYRAVITKGEQTVARYVRSQRTTAGALLALLLLFTVFPPFLASAREGERDTTRLLVELQEVGGDAALRRELQGSVYTVRKMSRRVPRSYTVDGTVRRASDLRRWRVIEVGTGEATGLHARLSGNPAVVSVHVEQVYEAALLPNDTLFSSQWGLKSVPLADIKAPAAWDITRGSSSTVIAVIDGGVDVEHEDLRDKIWDNPGEIAGNNADDDGNGFIDDVHGWDFVEGRSTAIAHNHGTHVAGIAAAGSNNGVGIAGVDWSARIMSVRVLTSFGIGGEENIIRGIDYAVAEGADIINLSLVGRPSLALLAAIENAYAAGVVVVAAAGNSGVATDFSTVYPVCAERAGVNMVLGVAALDDKGKPALFSNYGRCVDVAAPGKRIVSTVVGGRYKTMSGTSMSAPFAAGVAGLYLALNPGASPADVISAVSTGDSFVGERAEQWNARYKGRLTAARVVGAPADTLVPLPIPPSESAGGEALLTLDTMGPLETQPGAVLAYTLRVSNIGDGMARDVVAEGQFDRNLALVDSSVSDGCNQEGRTVRCRHGNLAPGETASLTLSFSVSEDVWCSATLRASAKVYALEGGRSRLAVRGGAVKTSVLCL